MSIGPNVTQIFSHSEVSRKRIPPKIWFQFGALGLYVYHGLKSTSMSTDLHLAWAHPGREEKGAQEGLLEHGNVE